MVEVRRAMQIGNIAVERKVREQELGVNCF
jgi:hypothetical protein